jgi:hypothetical protein
MSIDVGIGKLAVEETSRQFSRDNVLKIYMYEKVSRSVSAHVTFLLTFGFIRQHSAVVMDKTFPVAATRS